MNRENWTKYLVAAALVLIVGAVWVFAEEKVMKVEVRNEDGQELTIDVNGETEVIALDDLADGQQLDYEVGGHPFTVRRVGDELTLVHDGHDGHAMLMEHFGEGDAHHVWVTDDEEMGDGVKRVKIIKRGDGDEVVVDVLGDYEGEGDAIFISDGHPGDHDVIIMKGDEGEIDIDAMREKFGDDFDVDTTEDGKKIYKWKSAGHGAHPVMIKSGVHVGGGDFAHYRCEETGSMLTVKKDDALLESYIDPVTGCVMEKVDGEVAVRLVEIHKERIVKAHEED